MVIMKNLLEIKNLIQKSLDLLPLDINSRHIRSHLLMSLEEIKRIEKKNKFLKNK